MKCMHAAQVGHTNPVTLCQQHAAFRAGIVLTAIHTDRMSIAPTAVVELCTRCTLTPHISSLYSSRQA